MANDAPPADAVVPDEDVRAALVRVSHSASLRRSPQLRRLLTFLIEETTAGRGDRLKEYVIGTEVFARPPSYDPRLDSLVRVEARRLRAALAAYYDGDGRDDPVIIELPKGTYVPRIRSAPGPRIGDGEAQAIGPRTRGRSARRRLAAAFALLLAAVLILAFSVARRRTPAPALAERDSVVLTGFSNTTGDEVFDDTLKQGLLSELEQSPFFDIVPERRVADLLVMMGPPAGGLRDPSVAAGLCLRAGAKAFIAGTIRRLGTGYVVGLTGTACETGLEYVHLQREAPRKEAVLGALSAAARDLRRRLGESLASIERYGLPVEEATTASLDALRAYSVGRRTAREQGSPADVGFYQQALAVDPGFAAARAALGIALINVGQRAEGAAHLEAAYASRERVTERERFRISAAYEQAVSGDLEKAIQTYERWRRRYPREFAPTLNIGLAHVWLGEYDKAAAESREALRLEPANVLAYTNLAAVLIKRGRPGEASQVLDQAAGRGLSGTLYRLNRAYLAFLAGREDETQRELEAVRGKPDEGPLLALASDSLAHAGRLRQARALTRRAVASATAVGNREGAATWWLGAALRDAELGACHAARSEMKDALRLAQSRDAIILAALAAARCGDAGAARRQLHQLRQHYPRHTTLVSYWAPVIDAALDLGSGRPGQALKRLASVAPLDLASPPPFGLATLYPVYLRGEAYLALRDGPAARREFRTLLDHPGLVLNFCLHAAAQLQVARAEVLVGDAAQARVAYDQFLRLWLDADPELPWLGRARAERRALRVSR